MTVADKLTAVQGQAVFLILSGLTDQQVADQLGLARQTVNVWKNRDSQFMARLNLEREITWAAHREKLRSMVTKAVEVLGGGLDSQDERIRQNSAVHVLKSVGLYGQDLRPYGQTEAEDIEKEWGRDTEVLQIFERIGRGMLSDADV